MITILNDYARTKKIGVFAKIKGFIQVRHIDAFWRGQQELFHDDVASFYWKRPSLFIILLSFNVSDLYIFVPCYDHFVL